ncbi:hypothetical protein QBA57_14745 [Streptomyces scabiei]|uniref:hypothetical protein n=2 Tax=Streptomyces scabiei TaxID=1930 RepID=UPI001B30FBEC|nr:MULTISPECIES: hypothetical protein [Streptomyces]MBP5877923.1 hypothetical protein [Streptomyces sp. LBUM 1477]MBP5885755.1 hypothetical protein [Streptomyces sp. LBUM 1487]MDW8475273.1 hypothetical protein [Streptomyces scabiei]MDX2572185.1 hypothetical protein [Streptomyces scabiei]MDX2631909.1 hypothetical protein [Streptomyces scabiei]
MSLVELLAQADERGLAASGLACLDRCVPLLGGDDEVLRPLWAELVDGGEGWGAKLAKARGELALSDADADADADAGGAGADVGAGARTAASDEEAVLLARRMLDAVPDERSGDALRAWADICSVSALRIHQLLDPLDAGGDDSVADCRAGRTEGASHLVAAELRRQVVVLELLAQHGAAGMRQALGAATEGRRVLRAVVSRRARGARR